MYMTADSPEANFAVVSSHDKHTLKNFHQFRLRRAMQVIASKEAVFVRRANHVDQHESHDPLADGNEIHE